ncbi:unnamed protein product [Rotaria socialis]|uniref:Uncharacterized protein n=1 Tax=Rotaria socialis TaxID=392032 RepID=A0A821SFI3_9BILA|nr:unnamed protein product [Rotaria socialis]CAF3801756.1 unnamed protein product [Rotaria socialis]CAF4377996.1 unnamed protein product [Rotaria socialis]CAF4854212.1 unnamed protein product [Rotaria socialis]
MNNTNKLSSRSLAFSEYDPIEKNTKYGSNFRRSLYPRPPPSTPRTDPSLDIVYPFINSRRKNPLTHSVLMESASHRSGFLPHNYRLENTLASIRRQRLENKSIPKRSVSTSRVNTRASPRLDVFGNLTSKMSKLAEQRLILREKSNKNKQNPSSLFDKHDRSLILSDGDFATDIPNAIETLLQSSPFKSTMELNLFEVLKRERLQQARYRLLPINRAPNA